MDKLFDFDSQGVTQDGLVKSQELLKVEKQILDAINNYDEESYMNMIFSGAPETVKSTVGKLTAKLLCAKGIVKKDSFTQFDASECINRCIGQSAQAIMDKLNENIGGVIMIDDFCKPLNEEHLAEEAVDAVLNFISMHSNDTVLILCGYKEEVLKTLSVNIGSMSKFPNIIEFDA